MWIKQLRLQNFQSYYDETFNFHPNFNCLVGTGNSGKSAIVRALSFLFYGKWDSSWIKHGKSSCTITLVTDSGVEVVREKGKKVNKYVLKVPGQKEQVYENFGVNIPDDIQNALSIFKAKVGGKDDLALNISNQLDPLFLLSDSGSFRAKVFGHLSKAHYLDFSLREINKAKKTKNTEKSVLEKQKAELEKEITKYDDLDDKLKAFENIRTRLEEFDSVIKFVDKAKELKARTKDWKEKYSREKKIKYKLSKIDFERLKTVENSYTSLKDLKTVSSKLHNCESKRTNIIKSINALSKEKENLANRYTDILKSNGKCPVCFNDIDKERLNQFVESVNA